MPLSANPVVTLFVNSRRWSSLRVVFSDKKLYGNCLYWLNILYQKFFALPWKTEFAVKFSTAWNIFFIIQDFWGTCACPEKQSCPEIFHSIEIFFFIQGFWATCERLLWKTEVPRKFSLYWNIFNQSLFLSILRFPWKQSLPWINCIEYTCFIIQDFWATCACPENRVCPGTFLARGTADTPPRTPMNIRLRRRRRVETESAEKELQISESDVTILGKKCVAISGLTQRLLGYRS